MQIIWPSGGCYHASRGLNFTSWQASGVRANDLTLVWDWKMSTCVFSFLRGVSVSSIDFVKRSPLLDFKWKFKFCRKFRLVSQIPSHWLGDFSTHFHLISNQEMLQGEKNCRLLGSSQLPSSLGVWPTLPEMEMTDVVNFLGVCSYALLQIGRTAKNIKYLWPYALKSESPFKNTFITEIMHAYWIINIIQSGIKQRVKVRCSFCPFITALTPWG